MISVFTNYLSPYYEKGLLPEVEKPSDIYDQLRIAYNQGSVGVANTTRMVTLFNDDEDSYDIIEAIWSEPKLAYWLKWVNRKITLEIGMQSYQTLDVRLRIATSMLYGLVDKGHVNKYIATRIHMNLCENLRNENILVVNEDLPF